MTPLETVKEKFASVILDSHSFRGDETAIIKPEALLEVAAYLKSASELEFDYLMDVTAVDYLMFGGGKIVKEPRFEVVYHFYSLKHNHRIRIKVPVGEVDPKVDTLCSLWPSANWYEREVWDMFGIKFTGHPNLKRILMYEEFKGHALRKDYRFNKRQPLIGPNI